MEASKIGLVSQRKRKRKYSTPTEPAATGMNSPSIDAKPTSNDFLHLAQGTLGFTADFDSSTTDLGSTLPGQLTAEKSVAAD